MAKIRAVDTSTSWGLIKAGGYFLNSNSLPPVRKISLLTSFPALDGSSRDFHRLLVNGKHRLMPKTNNGVTSVHFHHWHAVSLMLAFG